jgi:hypothetical protein
MPSRRISGGEASREKDGEQSPLDISMLFPMRGNEGTHANTQKPLVGP